MARRGFTLSEVMVALFVSGIVLTAVMSSFLSARRMMAEVMAESETALAARELREKLLFHAAPTIGGVHYAGMLSGTNTGWVVESGSGYVLMDITSSTSAYRTTTCTADGCGRGESRSRSPR